MLLLLLSAAVLFSFVQKFSAALGWLHKFLNNQHTQPRAERKKRKAEKTKPKWQWHWERSTF